MIKRHPEPLLWILFSAGGIVSAMLMPILVLLFGLAFPLGWLAPPPYERMLRVMTNPITRVVLFALVFLSLFHWAHRFRHTLYDGLQIKHLNEVIALVSYGLAVVGTTVAGYLIWRIA
jgi:fumarate reductase subunit D